MRLLLRHLAVLALLAGPAAAQHPAAPAPDPLEPATVGGLAAVDRALAQLSTHRRLLVIGAHPDDEDTNLLALVSRGMGGEAAYLSLSRGEGGQNLIGPELGVGLGLLRTGELLAARRIEGARQFFTPAYDFGYTRSLDETLERWPLSVLLAGAERIVRRFKPQVIVSVFPGDGRGGHGQHQAAGLVAHRLFEVSGDPLRFRRLELEGVPPWQPRALYRRAWWRPEEASLEMPLGAIDPFTGRSIFQLASASRSMHRSQDMGRLQEPGPRGAGLAWVAGGAGPAGDDLFAGIDTRLAAIAAPLPEGEARRGIEELLGGVEATAREARRRLNPLEPGRVAPDLAAILGRLRQVRELLPGARPLPAERVVGELLEEKIEVAAMGLAAAAGIMLDAVSDQEVLAPGGSLEVTLSLWNTGAERALPVRLELTAAPGWGPAPFGSPGGPLWPGELREWRTEVELTAEAEATVPYFLARPPAGAIYDWSLAPPEVRGEPFAPPPLLLEVELELYGARVELRREVVHRYRDQAVGEVRLPVRAAPRLELSVSPGLIVWPIAVAGERTLEVVLESNVDAPLRGRLEVSSPAGWPAPDAPTFEIAEPRGRTTVALVLRPPEPFAAGDHRLQIAARLQDGGRYSAGLEVVDHPHIRPAAMPVRAEVEVRGLDLELPKLARIGYVRGASDRVPEALRQVGLPIELLGAGELRGADLGSYDAIVIGSRAYESEPALGRSNRRLLGYVRGGGTLIVQYQQYQFVEGGFTPYRLEIARPHDRVTDEASPVRLLVPDNPAFHVPNEIGEGDWRQWVQERGLYFAADWEVPFFPLLAMRDSGEPEKSGGLLLARVGEGVYVYTGLSFFRQLPAGVPGAFRLFANLLALGETW